MALKDEVWNALREQCCATKPWQDAKAIVMVRECDVAAAVAALERKWKLEHWKFQLRLARMRRNKPTATLRELMRSVSPWDGK